MCAVSTPNKKLLLESLVKLSPFAVSWIRLTGFIPPHVLEASFKMSSKVAQAISAIQHTLPHAHHVTPEAVEEYQWLNNSYLSGFESDLSRACIFLPRSKDEVAAFICAIGPFVGDVEFAVRAAGRQPLPGCANVHGGITVDLWSLKGIHVQDGQVHVAAGELWGSVYEHLEPHGLGLTGGKSTTCGIGGLATQGMHKSVS
jgi:FAD/FMN-containing dehydrogenase